MKKIALNLFLLIAWLQPGQISKEDFLKIIEKPEDVIILDVRSPEETSKGMIPGAINIPHTELEKRYTELPRDKKIVIYCSSGWRAEFSYGLLKNYLGFDDVWFLSEPVNFYPDGKFFIGK